MTEIKTYKCPCCNAALNYDGKADKMLCSYCGVEINVETLLQSDYAENRKPEQEAVSWDKYGKDKSQWTEQDNFDLLTCPSCGGELLCDANTAATECPYCNNPTLIGKKLSGAYKPDLIIPFRKSKEDAKNALLKLYKGKKLLPKFFKEENHINSVKGMYVPFWLYCCDTESSFVYNATRIHSWTSGDYIYTKTDYFKLFRDGELGFEQVPVDASKKIENSMLESVEPYDYKDAVEFKDSYLSGFLADKYDDTAEDCNERAKERIKRSVESELRGTAQGYTGVTVASSNIYFGKNEVHYALLPVWFLNTNYKGKTYPFIMNGQTGKITGNLPIDNKKYFAWLFGLTLGIGTLGSLIVILMSLL